MKKFIFFFFLIILCVNVSAVSFGKLSPDESYVFEPNLEIVKKYSLGGEAGKSFSLKVEIVGPQSLDQYIHKQPETLQGNGVMTLNISLPDKIEGGNYQFVVCGIEIKDEAQGGIGIASQVCTRFGMLATLPGKSLKVNSFSVPDADTKSETIDLSFSVSNWGKETIESVLAVFDVYDINNENAGQVITTTPLRLESTETKSAMVPLNIKGLNPGEFVVKGKLTWDEGEEEIEDGFRLGSADFKILNITRKFKADDVNDLTVTIKNDFGGDKTPISLNVKISGLTVTPPVFGLKAFESKTITTFLDTRGFEPGFYDARVVISSGDDVVEKDFQFEFVKKSLPAWLFYVLGGVVLVILILFLVLKMRKKNEEEPSQKEFPQV